LQELRDIFIEMESTYDAALVGSKYSTPRPHKKTFQLALWICLSTLSRIGELLMAKWEDVDLELGHWEIPISNVKGSIGKKSAHLVSLSSFAISQFKSLHILTGHTKYLFPSMSAQLHVDVKTVSKLVGDSQCMFKKLTKPLSGRRNDNSLALNKGLDGDWNTHDLRRTGATMMQSLGIDLNVIDRCQNHVLEGSKVRRSYLHHKYHDEKKIAWQKLSDELDAIFSEVPKVRLGRKVLKSPSIATTRNQMSSEGLRNNSKTGGSPFGESSPNFAMSCYKCGRHKPRRLGTFKRLLNQSMFMCSDCKPAPKV
jgi:hypothetical protein